MNHAPARGILLETARVARTVSKRTPRRGAFFMHKGLVILLLTRQQRPEIALRSLLSTKILFDRVENMALFKFYLHRSGLM